MATSAPVVDFRRKPLPDEFCCPVCTEDLDPAMSYVACMHKVCDRCSAHCDRCPMCRAASRVKPHDAVTTLVKRLQSAAPWVCLHCGVETTDRSFHSDCPLHPEAALRGLAASGFADVLETLADSERRYICETALRDGLDLDAVASFFSARVEDLDKHVVVAGGELLPLETLANTAGLQRLRKSKRGTVGKLCPFGGRCPHRLSCADLHPIEHFPNSTEEEAGRTAADEPPTVLVLVENEWLDASLLVPSGYLTTLINQQARQLSNGEALQSGRRCWHGFACLNGTSCRFIHCVDDFEDVVVDGMRYRVKSLAQNVGLALWRSGGVDARFCDGIDCSDVSSCPFLHLSEWAGYTAAPQPVAAAAVAAGPNTQDQDAEDRSDGDGQDSDNDRDNDGALDGTGSDEDDQDSSDDGPVQPENGTANNEGDADDSN